MFLAGSAKWARFLLQTRLFAAGKTGAAHADANSKEKEIKTQLNKLYKLVHPDLFHSHPTAKVENERSFKLLQEFISGSSHQHGGARTTAYQLKFYLKKSSDHTSGSVVASESSSEVLEQVAVELRRPYSVSGWRGKEAGISPELAPALNKLLKACGLGTISVSDEEYAVAGEGEPEDAYVNFDASLRDFLPFAADRYHRAKGSPNNTQQTDMVRSTLRLFRGVITSFSSSLKEEEHRTERNACLNSLVKVLDRDPSIDVRGVKLILDRDFRVSATGAVHVEAKALRSAEDWERYFESSKDLGVARVRAEFVQGVRQHEDEIASKLGIASFHCSSAALSQNEVCQDLVEELVATAEGAGNAICSSTKVVVDNKHEFYINETDGTIVVPLSRSADQILDFLLSHSAEADRISLRYEKELKEISRLKSLVRSRLKVRVFTKGDGVTIHQFRQCSNRLVRMSKSLVTHTEGLNLRVGSTNKIDLHQNCIEIAWNFA